MAGGKARHGVLFVSAGLAVGKGALQLTIEGPPPIFLSIGVRHPNQVPDETVYPVSLPGDIAEAL